MPDVCGSVYLEWGQQWWCTGVGIEIYHIHFLLGLVAKHKNQQINETHLSFQLHFAPVPRSWVAWGWGCGLSAWAALGRTWRTGGPWRTWIRGSSAAGVSRGRQHSRSGEQLPGCCRVSCSFCWSGRRSPPPLSTHCYSQTVRENQERILVIMVEIHTVRCHHREMEFNTWPVI